MNLRTVSPFLLSLVLLAEPFPAGINSSASAMDGSCSVTVHADEPKVRFEYYDPAGPIPPGIEPGMKGHTFYNFVYETTCNYLCFGEAPSFVFHFTSISLHISLPITVTLPKGADASLSAHEEGHRKICNYYYTAYAKESARRACALAGAQDFNVPAANKEEGGREAIRLANNMIGPEYFKTTFSLAKQANRYYDQLTNHGRTPGVIQDQAADSAIQKFQPGGAAAPDSDMPAQ